MNIATKTSILALALGVFSFSASADDLIGTIGQGKGGRTTVALDLITSGESTVFEFVIDVPKGATNVDVSKCLSSLPSSHIGKCQYNAESGEVIGIAYSTTNALLQKGALDLGSVTFNNSLQKGGKGASIRGLQVGNNVGAEIPSNIQIEDALLGK
jgi:hypothetical protein